MKRFLAFFLSLLFIAALAAGCNNDPPPAPTPTPTQAVNPQPPANTPQNPDNGSDDPDPEPVHGPMMISAAELSDLMGSDNVILIGVINPTAALVPFSNAANPVRGSYLVWSPDFLGTGNPESIAPNPFFRKTLSDMEDLISRSGATEDSLFVVYSSDHLSQGARVAWQLRLLGLNVRFLDGGVAAWRAHGGRTGSSNRLADQRVQSEFRAPSYNVSEYDASIETVIEALQNPAEWVVIDTRGDGEYNGDRPGAGGGFGAGRLKGAVHINWEDATDSDGNLLPEAQLRNLYSFVGDRKVIVFCQGGVRSAYTWMVLHDLGYDVLNYNGSWAEWSWAASSAGSYHNRDVVLSLTEEWTDNNGQI